MVARSDPAPWRAPDEPPGSPRLYAADHVADGGPKADGVSQVDLWRRSDRRPMAPVLLRFDKLEQGRHRGAPRRPDVGSRPGERGAAWNIQPGGQGRRGPDGWSRAKKLAVRYRA